MNIENSVVKLFVPGRLCLFGEHSDWAGTNRKMNANIVPGHAIVTGIEQGIYGYAQKADQFIVTSELEEYADASFSCEMNVRKLREAAKNGGFFSYVAGVASYICEWYRVGGLHLHITQMDLPMKSGLSSSAAICVMVAKAFNKLYKLNLNTLGIMNIAYLGEQRTPSRCGRLDQACAFGIKSVDMIFDGDEIEVTPIYVKQPLHYVFADLMAGKDTVKILADLNKGYPFPSNDREEKLQEALGADNEYYVSEARKYMENGDVESLGRLMIEAQHNFDSKVAPMCMEELEAPVLHQTLSDPMIQKYIYGGKGVGSQGDGTVQFLAKDAQMQEALVRYLQEERGMTAYKLTISSEVTVRKAVIPVAGFGTRLYPETRGVKKEFCPVIDKDDLVKPAIMVLLEELDEIEIEEICLILNREEEEYYKSFFFKELSENHYAKLSNEMKEYEKKIQKIAKKLKFVYQEEQKGFGHAVYQSREFANGEAVLLLLGDTIYQSRSGIPCTKQLVEIYERYGQPVVAVHKVDLQDVVHYGIFSGSFEDEEQTVIKLNKIVEKPDCDTAKEFLSVASKGKPDNYYAAFGAYIINNDVYDRLQYAIDHKIENRKGEIELTDALSYVMEQNGMLAFIPDGESYDLGNAEAYRRTVTEFGKESK